MTIREVAAEAGVGLGTVSRVLNGTGYTSREVRGRVAAAVEATGYRPSRRARSLRQARSMAIAAIIPELVNPVYVEFLRGVQRAAQERGYVVLIGETQHFSHGESRVVARLLEEGVDGFLVAGRLPPSDARLLEVSGTPLFPGQGPESRSYSAAWETAEAGATTAMATHLLALGHRRVALLAPASPGWIELGRYRRSRTDLLARRLRAAGGHLHVAAVDRADMARSCRRRVEELLAEPERPSAFVAANHSLAPLLLLALAEAGLELPADASFVAYGDSDWAQAYRPALTVVRHDTAAEAAWLASQLINQIEGVDLDPSPAVEAVFIDRQSCGPPPAGPEGRKRSG